MDLETRFRLTESRNPLSVELARWVSFASRVERALLRRARLLFVRHAGVAAEADLWFSPLVHTRTTREFLFHPEVAERLRRELVARQTPEEIVRAHGMVEEMHRHLPGLIRQEETLLRLSVQTGAGAEEALRDELAPVIKAVATQAGRHGLARWAVGILPFMPPSVRAGGGGLLEMLAQQQLFRGRITRRLAASETLSTQERALLTQAARQSGEGVEVGLRLVGRTLEISEPPREGDETCRVPATIPRVLDLEWGRDPRRSLARVTWQPGQAADCPEIGVPLTLASLTGERWRLSSVRQFQARLNRQAGPYLIHFLDAEEQLAGCGWMVARDKVMTSRNIWEKVGPDFNIVLPFLKSGSISGPISVPTSRWGPNRTSPLPSMLESHSDTLARETSVIALVNPHPDARPPTLGDRRSLSAGSILAAYRPPFDGSAVGSWERFRIDPKPESSEQATPLIPWQESTSGPPEPFDGSPVIDVSTMDVVGICIAAPLAAYRPIWLVPNDQLPNWQIPESPNLPREYSTESITVDQRRRFLATARRRRRVGDLLTFAEDIPSPAPKRKLQREAAAIMVRQEQFKPLLIELLETITGVTPSASGRPSLETDRLDVEAICWLSSALMYFERLREARNCLGLFEEPGPGYAGFYGLISQTYLELVFRTRPGTMSRQSLGEEIMIAAARGAVRFAGLAWLREPFRLEWGLTVLMLDDLIAGRSSTWISPDMPDPRELESKLRGSARVTLERGEAEGRVTDIVNARTALGLMDLRAGDTTSARRHYEASLSLPGVQETHLQAMTKQLARFESAGLPTDEMIRLRLLVEEKRQTPSYPQPYKRVFVGSGHMIDRSDRAKPRFPPKAEPWVRKEIARNLQEWDLMQSDLALCGAANGADILFAESCLQRGARVRLLIALPEQEYLERSVRFPGDPSWEARFHTLLKRVDEVWFQPDRLGPTPGDTEVFSRCNTWILQTARAEASAGGLYGMLVWDEVETGDGPGGTAHFAREFQHGGEGQLAIINPTKI